MMNSKMPQKIDDDNSAFTIFVYKVAIQSASNI